MFLIGTWLCLLFIKDLNAEHLFVFADHNITFVDTDKNITEYISVKVRDIMAWDYHYSKGILYFIERTDHTKGTLYRIRLIQTDETVFAVRAAQVSTQVYGVAVDWVRDKVYMLLYGTVIRAELNGIKPMFVVTQEKATDVLKSNSTGLVITISVDPYEEIMFMAMSAPDIRGFYIFKSDLNGTYLRKQQEQLYQRIASVAVEINEKRVYVVDNVDSKVYVSDYEGKKLGEFTLEEKVNYLMNVLGNNMYISHYNGTKIYFSKFKMNSNYSMAERQDLISFDSSYSINQLCDTDQPQLGCVAAGVVVYDYRRQRRKRNGKYECEQNECSYDCEVLPNNSESCTCPPDHTLNNDNKTCSGGCKVPDPPAHRQFTKYPCPEGSECGLSPGTFVPHAQLVTVTCDPNHYKIQGVDSFSSERTIISCKDGAWFPSAPKCFKLCPPLTSPTVNFTCSLGPRDLSCDNLVLPETVAEYSCKENQTDILTCNPSGEWSETVPTCS